MKTFNVSISDEEVQEFKKICYESETNPSKELRKYIRRVLKERRVEG